MEDDVSYVVRSDDPGVLIGSDARFLTHTSCISVSNVSPVDV